jgi:hypothetical protein
MINKTVYITDNYKNEIGFQVSQDAIDLLRNVKERIGVIAVAGKYRTGKSFLLNRIILNKTDNSGFGVGPTINPCTKVSKLKLNKEPLKLLILGFVDMDQTN